jgi:hypothetical protein
MVTSLLNWNNQLFAYRALDSNKMKKDFKIPIIEAITRLAEG